MIPDPTGVGLPDGPSTKGSPPGRPVFNIGACFQLALLAAGQGNDQEAGNYLRQIVAGMKTLVKPGDLSAGDG